MTDADTKVVKLPRRTALKQTTLTETVYEAIRTRLRRGEIGPQARILDYEVADQFGCTRMPVRQALLRLVNEGYLEGTTRGFVIPTLTNDDVHDIFEVRRLLEPSAAAGTVAGLDKARDAALTRACKQARAAFEAHDTAALTDANIAFRMLWLDAVENTRLQNTIRRFADHAQQVRLATLDHAGTQKIVIEGMQELLDGFLARDARRVKTAMLEFILAAEQQYFARLG